MSSRGEELIIWILVQTGLPDTFDIMEETKICSKCKFEKSINEFSKNKSKKDGLNSHCNKCRKEYRDLNREKIANAGKKYRENNAQKISEYKRKYYLNNT